jgi:DNA-directed RNA polymerase specialized sigma24 family protein
MSAIPTGYCLSISDQNLMADLLLSWIPRLQQFLRRKGFTDFIGEKATDRILQAAMCYLGDEKRCQQIRDLSAWLYGSAFKAACQEASRELKCTFVDPSTFDLQCKSEPDQDLTEQIESALSQLTERQRWAVELCIMREKSPTEAAREMKCSRSTVQHHRDRGLLLLRRILSKSTFVHSAPITSNRQTG